TPAPARAPGPLCALSLHDALPIFEDALAAWRQVFLDPSAAHRLAEIGRRAVLAGEEAGGEAVIGDDADALGNAKVAQRALECGRSEEHTSELQSRENLVCRLLLEK